MACKSYRDNDRVCADGFIQRPKCCLWKPCQCGEYDMRYAPYCLHDELPAHMADADGLPLFYRDGGSHAQ